MTLLLPDPRPRMGLEVVVLAGARDVRARHEVPFDRAADVNRHVALALLQLGGDVFQRDRPGLKIEEREDAALELAQDAGGGSRSAQAVDEDRGRSIHALRLENSECSVNTVRAATSSRPRAVRDAEPSRDRTRAAPRRGLDRRSTARRRPGSSRAD